MLKKFLIRFLLITALLSACAYGFFLNIGSWLTTADAPEKADIIICLDGSSDRIDKAVLLLQKDLAEKIAVTTDAAYHEMLRKKVPQSRILKADWSAANTYQEGMIIKTLLDHRYQSVMVVSDSFHLYRVRWTLHHFFHDNAIRFALISSDAPSLQGFWWSKPDSRLFVLSELPKIVYYWIWHGLLNEENDPKWTKGLERVYMDIIQKVFIRRVSSDKRGRLLPV